MKLKLQYFGHLMRRTNALEKSLLLRKIEGGRRGWERMRCLDVITDSIDMRLSKLRESVMHREAQCAVAHAAAKSRTWLNDWTELNLVDLENIMVNNVRQNHKYCMTYLYLESKKHSKIIYKNLTHKFWEQIGGCQNGELRVGEMSDGGKIYLLLVINKVLVM